MKAIKVLLAASLLISAMAMPAMASDFVPSRERDKEIDVVSYEQGEADDADKYLSLFIHGGKVEVCSADGYELRDEISKSATL